MIAPITNLSDFRGQRARNAAYRQALANAAPALRELQQAYQAAYCPTKARDNFGLVLAMLANVAEKAQDGDGGTT